MDPKSVLLDMDEDEDGAIDKKEMLVGAHVLGIAITPLEMDLIWPLFGPCTTRDSIPVERFLDTYVTRSPKDEVHAPQGLHAAMLSLDILKRQDRIRQKTMLAERLGSLSAAIRAKLVQTMEEKSLTCEEVFALFDTDLGGTIDKQEFHQGLEELGMTLTDMELDCIWPLFNLDRDGTITVIEWEKFVSDKVGWSYKLLEDRFSTLMHSEAHGATKCPSLVQSKSTKKCTRKEALFHHLGIGSVPSKRPHLRQRKPLPPRQRKALPPLYYRQSIVSTAHRYTGCF
jgi:Ca2+-binding EF-hand superfamily protein